MRVIREKGTKTWWADTDKIGEFLFSMDKKKVFNLFRDYPEKLDVNEWADFTEDNPFWAKFFKDRNIEYITKRYDEICNAIGEDRLDKIVDSMENENEERA